MKPTERFFEANFYSQVASSWYPTRLTWFTPSTVDEALWAFDTFVHIGGRFLFFQFKHPSVRRVRRTLCAHDHSYLQTHAPHAQLLQFRQMAEGWPANTFHYAMPGLLDWGDYAAVAVDLLPNTFYFDVKESLPYLLPAPTKEDGHPRLSGIHYLNLDPECARFQLRSEPITIAAARFSGLPEVDQVDPSNLPERMQSRAGFGDFVAALPRGTMGLLMSPQ